MDEITLPQTTSTSSPHESTPCGQIDRMACTMQTSQDSKLMRFSKRTLGRSTSDRFLSLRWWSFLPKLSIEGGSQVRLVRKGRTVWTPTSWQQYIQEAKRQDSTCITFHIEFESWGGAATKQAQMTRVKNQVATLWLKEGQNLHWVSNTVNQLIRRYGVQKIDAVAGNLATQTQALVKLTKDANIEIPMVQRGAASTTAKKRQMPQREPIELYPANYEIQAGTPKRDLNCCHFGPAV